MATTRDPISIPALLLLLGGVGLGAYLIVRAAHHAPGGGNQTPSGSPTPSTSPSPTRPAVTFGGTTSVPVITTTACPQVGVGSGGDLVRAIQESLGALGYTVGALDGIYGPQTKAAVAAFQGVQGITADGIVGPDTYAALNRALGQLGGSFHCPTIV